MNCLYCNSTQHTIETCYLDNELKNIILNCKSEPIFKNLGDTILKKICVLFKVNINSDKNKLLKDLTKQYNLYKNGEKKKCPICLEYLESLNICKTSCGHEFHLSCIMENNKNSCPLCRKELFYNNEKIMDNLNNNDNFNSANNLLFNILNTTLESDQIVNNENTDEGKSHDEYREIIYPYNIFN